MDGLKYAKFHKGNDLGIILMVFETFLYFKIKISFNFNKCFI